MSFARTTAVAGIGTVSCTGTTTVTGTGTAFAFGFGSIPTGTQARVGGTITVGGVTKTITAITSATSLTVDSAFGTFTAQSFTVQTGITQTGADTMNLSLGSATGFVITNRGDLYRTFDCQGNDLTINGTLTISSSVAQLRNDGSCNNRLTVVGSASGGELIFNGRISTAGNGPIPYAGLDWLGTNGMGGATALNSTNATYPAKLTVIDACIRFGGDWFTVSSGNFARITTQGDECWILCAKGTGTVQGRIRLNNNTPVLDFQAKQTWIGTWLNFGVPQVSLKGFTPIFTDGPEINLDAVAVATRITIEDYDTRYIQAAYYAGSQLVMYGGGWTRLKNNLLGSDLTWRSVNAAVGRYNIVELSKQVKAVSKDAAGNLLSDGYLYFTPTGSNVAGIRPKGVTTDVTFDLSKKTIQTVSGVAETEFVYAWDYSVQNVNESSYNYFCSGTTKGAETHPAFVSRYGYDTQPITMQLRGNSTFEYTAFHTSLPTTDKVIANAAAITGVAFDFTTKTITLSISCTIQQIYDAYQYQRNQPANLGVPDDCLTANSTSNYVGWSINVNTGVTVSTGAGNFTILQAQNIILNENAKIEGVYKNSVGTSTIWEFGATGEPIIAGTSLAIYDNAGVTKYYNAVTSDGVYRYYIAPQAVGATYTYAIERYGYKREEGTFPSNAGGILFYVPGYSEDVGITQATLATVQAYTTLSDTAQIYDATANFRLSETGIKLGQLVARDGTYLDFGNFNVKIKDDASAIVAVVSGTITYKSIVINESTKYNAMKATPPKTITPTDTEIINVLIEDANGDSKLAILGGDNLGYELWKVTTATATDDYATGTLLTTLATNDQVFRFIGISGFDIVGRDTSSGVRRRTSMLKGSYEQAFYVGNQIQLATDAPQLLETIDKLEELTLKVDTNLDVKVSTRLADADYIDPATAQQVWEYATRTLTSAGASGATLAEIEASTILAKESTCAAIKTKTDRLTFNAQDHVASNTHQIQASVVGEIKSGVATQSSVDALGAPLQASSYVSPPSAQDIAAQVETAILDEADGKAVLQAIADKIGNENVTATVIAQTVRTELATELARIDVAVSSRSTLTAEDIPEGLTAEEVWSNTSRTLTETAGLTSEQAAVLNDIQAKVTALPDAEATSTQVWEDQPDRLKVVSTVEITGAQIAAL